MRKIKTGSIVKVMRGKNKGKIGKVLAVKIDKRDPNNKIFLFIEGLNLYKKSVKPNLALGIKGGVKEVHLPIHISNVMLYNPEQSDSSVDDKKKVS